MEVDLETLSLGLLQAKILVRRDAETKKDLEDTDQLLVEEEKL